MPYGDEQKQLISEMNTKVAECRRQYKQWKDWAATTGNREAWQAIGPAIIVKAEYYKLEILRAKHNIARYMLGKDVHPGRYPGMWLEDIDYQLHQIKGELHEIEERYAALKSVTEEWRRELASSLYESAEQSYKITIDNLVQDADWGRKKIYAGTV